MILVLIQMPILARIQNLKLSLPVRRPFFPLIPYQNKSKGHLIYPISQKVHIIKRLQQIGSSTLPLGLHWPHRARWCHVRTPRPRDVQRHLHNLPILCIRQRLQRDPILQPRSLPEFCTVACASTSRFDVQNKLGVDGQGLPAVCNMVVAYVLSEADVPQGMYCAMYTQSWAEEYATNVGQWRQNDRGVEEWWAVSQAYAFVNSTYSALWDPICATGGCDGGSYQGGNYVLL